VGSGGAANGFGVREAQHAPQSERDRTPVVLGPVLDLGRSTVRVGLVLGALLALIPHTYASVRSQTALFDMLHWVQETRGPIHDYFWTLYDVELPKETTQPKEEPPPEPEPPPPPPTEQPAPKINDDPYKETPPPQAAAPAKADDIYNAKDDGQQPLDFGTMVDNDGGKGSGHGVQANEGQGTAPVTQKGTKIDGTPGGTGTGTAPAAAPPAPDKSRPPTLAGSTSWNCPFPAEADAEGRDSAVATIIVKVRPDGSPESVSVVNDPGSGFGRAARSCALTRRYQPGLDRDGNATTASTPPIRVRFSR
jgi:protein TonB